jgi:hypothetical protein
LNCAPGGTRDLGVRVGKKPGFGTTKNAALFGAAFSPFRLSQPKSGRPDVFGIRSLRAASFRELNSLTFAEVIESHALEGRHVEEQVFARAHVDESKALVRQTLNRTFSHRHTIGTRLVLSNPEHSGTLPDLVREQCLRIGLRERAGHSSTLRFRLDALRANLA